MSPSASGSWEGKGAVLGVHTHPDTGHWNMSCSARVNWNQQTPVSYLCRGAWFLLPGRCSPALLYRNPDVLLTWSTRCSFPLDSGSRVAGCGNMTKANWVSGACIVYLGTQHGHIAAQARTHYWHHHTQAQRAEMSPPGKSQRPVWAHSDHCFVDQLSLWALNHGPGWKRNKNTHLWLGLKAFKHKEWS